MAVGGEAALAAAAQIASATSMDVQTPTPMAISLFMTPFHRWDRTCRVA
jgi:hypothetical protein